MEEMTSTQNILLAIDKLLECEDRSDVVLIIQAAIRACSVLPSYQQFDTALSILTLPSKPEDDDDA